MSQRNPQASQDAPHATQSGEGAEKQALGVRTPERGVQGLVVRLPLPSVALQPNRPRHYMVRAEAKRAARWEAACAALVAMQEQHPAFVDGRADYLFGACRATVRVTWPDRRRRDLDNLLASMKSAFDGFTDAGVWRDDSYVTWILPPARVDKATAGVVITITPIAEGE